MPDDLTGGTQQQAETALRNAGLTPGQVSREANPARAGTVIRTDPAPGTRVAPCRPVDLVVSAGEIG
jgi:serine/threonine-protein kinase